MPQLPLPLHCYDEAGRVVPAAWFNLVFLWGARGLLLLAASAMLGARGQGIPDLFFPFTWQLQVHSLLGLLFLAIWLAVGRREWFWQKQYKMKGFKYFAVLLLVLDITAQTVVVILSKGAFSWLTGFSLLITLFALGYMLRSKRTRIMFNDWSC